MDYKKYEKLLLCNMEVMSRTVNGVVDVSASSTKKNSMLVESGTEVQILAKENVDKAFKFIYENRKRVFLNSEELKSFILNVAHKVNCGVVKDGKLFRNGADSSKYKYIKIARMECFFNWFCEELLCKIKSSGYDAIETACFVEYSVNFIGHFFSDGCGKISMLLSAFVLMREDMPLPEYKDRDTYYKLANERPVIQEYNYIDPVSYLKFLLYYRTLFN